MITANEFSRYANEIELSCALKGVRARCVSVYDSDRTEKMQGYDYNLRMAIAKAIAQECDATIICGNRLSDEMFKYLLLANQLGRPLYADESAMRLLSNKMREYKLHISSIGNIYDSFVAGN